MNNEAKSRSRLRRVLVAFGATALTMACLMVAPAATADGGLDWTITNYDNDHTYGVYLRNSADINDVVRDGAHYATYGTTVHLLCGTFGSSVGPHANTAWDRVQVTSGPTNGLVGYISEHWVNTPVGTNQHVAGEPDCSAPPPSGPSARAQGAINWATGQLGSTAWHNLCLSFVRNAYASAGVDLRGEVSVPWGSDTYPQDIWGHFTAGTSGTGTPPAGALAFYLARSGYSKAYSHVTIATDGSGNTISSTDTLDRTYVHRESIAQHSASGAYNTYVGWWLP